MHQNSISTARRGSIAGSRRGGIDRGRRVLGVGASTSAATDQGRAQQQDKKDGKKPPSSSPARNQQKREDGKQQSEPEMAEPTTGQKRGGAGAGIDGHLCGHAACLSGSSGGGKCATGPGRQVST